MVNLSRQVKRTQNFYLSKKLRAKHFLKFVFKSFFFQLVYHLVCLDRRDELFLPVDYLTNSRYKKMFAKSEVRFPMKVEEASFQSSVDRTVAVQVAQSLITLIFYAKSLKNIQNI